MTDLERGDCPQERTTTSSFCYYHEKLVDGLTEPTGELYPVWPIPAEGYVLVDALAVA